MDLKNKKRLTAGSVVAAAIVAVAASTVGAFAYFQDKDNTNSSGTAGAVDIAGEEISLNGAQMSVVGHGYKFDYGTFTGAGSDTLGGWTNEGKTYTVAVPNEELAFSFVRHKSCVKDDNTGGVVYTSNGKYYCEDCKSEWNEFDSKELGRTSAFIEYFRTSDGKVAYCIDYGKIQPTDGTVNMSAELSGAIKRALNVGYPSKHYDDPFFADLGLTEDWQVEQATTMALYVIEGKYYNKNGEAQGWGLTRNYIESRIYVRDQQKTEAILNAMDRIVDYAKIEGNEEIATFTLNATSTEVIPTDSASFVGPYFIEAADGVVANLQTDKEGITFYDDINGNQITSIGANQRFYVKAESTVTEDIDFTASADIDVVPNYYYWGGNVAEQRMVIASKVPAVITANISKIQQLMPGDVLDVNWTVENLQNKAVVTRNKVYLWWEGEKEHGNAIENTYLFKGDVDKGTIQTEMLDGSVNDTSLLFDGAGDIHDFTIDGGETTHRGYSFTIMGDCLDGAGVDGNAEVFKPGTTEHYGEGAGEVSYNNGYYDDNDPTRDVVGFKLGFAQKANINTSGATLHMVVITESMQWQNTVDSEFDTMDWTVTGRTDYTIN